MIRVLPALIELGLLIYCLIDCIQTPPDEVRNLGKVWWIVLIILLPLIGSIAWLVAGRPTRGRGTVPWPSTRTAGFPAYERPRPAAPRGPDDDPEFLRQMSASNREQEDLLRRWEDDLRRREQQLRKPDDEPPATG